jgi:3-hydroxybutyryl-CoA dehydrogenase
VQEAKTMEPIRRVLVAGYGVMGRGIAKSFAERGFETWVLSRRAKALSDLPKGVKAVDALPQDVPDLVIETVEEEVARKREIYNAVEKAYPPSVIVGTNTSGLMLEDLAAEFKAPERFCGIHYFQPADVFPMVEVIAGPSTPRETIDRVADAIRGTGKEPIVQMRAVPGFLINRLQHAILHEAYHLISSGVCTPHEVDLVAKWMLGPRMCVTGLIEQKDISGLTIHAKAQQAIVPHLAHDGTPNTWVQQMIGGGDLGLRTGRGFYDWKNCDAKAVAAQAAQRVEAVLTFLKQMQTKTAPATTPQPRPEHRGDSL